jgi:hypothetical protein
LRIVSRTLNCGIDKRQEERKKWSKETSKINRGTLFREARATNMFQAPAKKFKKGK